QLNGLDTNRHIWLVALVSLLGIAVPTGIQSKVQASSTGVSSVSCSSGSTTDANCLALTTSTGATSPIGLSPAHIKAAYSWPTKLTVGAGQTIAIVDARDNPAVESDLAVFDQQYGLPDCTTANGCFTKVDSNGGTNYPPFSKGWEF